MFGSWYYYRVPIYNSMDAPTETPVDQVKPAFKPVKKPSKK